MVAKAEVVAKAVVVAKAKLVAKAVVVAKAELAAKAEVVAKDEAMPDMLQNFVEEECEKNAGKERHPAVRQYLRKTLSFGKSGLKIFVTKTV